MGPVNVRVSMKWDLPVVETFEVLSWGAIKARQTVKASYKIFESRVWFSICGILR